MRMSHHQGKYYGQFEITDLIEEDFSLLSDEQAEAITGGGANDLIFVQDGKIVARHLLPGPHTIIYLPSNPPTSPEPSQPSSSNLI